MTFSILLRFEPINYYLRKWSISLFIVNQIAQINQTSNIILILIVHKKVFMEPPPSNTIIHNITLWRIVIVMIDFCFCRESWLMRKIKFLLNYLKWYLKRTENNFPIKLEFQLNLNKWRLKWNIFIDIKILITETV